MFPEYLSVSYDYDLIIKLTVKNKMILWCSEKEKFFIQTILSFVLSRKIINIYNDIAQNYGNVTVKNFRKYEKLE